MGYLSLSWQVLYSFGFLDSRPRSLITSIFSTDRNPDRRSQRRVFAGSSDRKGETRSGVRRSEGADGAEEEGGSLGILDSSDARK